MNVINDIWVVLHQDVHVLLGQTLKEPNCKSLYVLFVVGLNIRNWFKVDLCLYTVAVIDLIRNLLVVRMVTTVRMRLDRNNGECKNE